MNWRLLRTEKNIEEIPVDDKNETKLPSRKVVSSCRLQKLSSTGAGTNVSPALLFTSLTERVITIDGRAASRADLLAKIMSAMVKEERIVSGAEPVTSSFADTAVEMHIQYVDDEFVVENTVVTPLASLVASSIVRICSDPVPCAKKLPRCSNVMASAVTDDGTNRNSADPR